MDKFIEENFKEQVYKDYIKAIKEHNYKKKYEIIIEARKQGISFEKLNAYRNLTT